MMPIEPNTNIWRCAARPEARPYRPTGANPKIRPMIKSGERKPTAPDMASNVDAEPKRAIGIAPFN